MRQPLASFKLHSRGMRAKVGNVLKAISLVLLLLYGAVFGEGAIDNGRIPLIAIGLFLLIAAIFWIGEKLSPMR